MRKGIVSVFLLFGYALQAQQPGNCRALEAILTYAPATRPFYFDKNKLYPIAFYDTSGVFGPCVPDTFYGREVSVINRLPDTGAANPSVYLILEAKQGKRIISLILYYKTTGAYCEFVLIKKRNSCRVKKFREAYL